MKKSKYKKSNIPVRHDLKGKAKRLPVQPYLGCYHLKGCSKYHK